MQHRFTATTFLLLGGLLVWMANFVFVYVFAALACARGFAYGTLFGLPIVTFAALLASLLAAAVTVWIVRRGYRLLNAAETNETTRFIGFVATAGGVLSLIALALLFMPTVVITACPNV
jgi:hypothetical protein